MAPIIPIIDTHQHVWDLDRFRLPWLKACEPLNRSFLPADYLEATRGLKIAKTVYMEADVEPSQNEAEAEFAIELCCNPDTPIAASVIGGRLAEPGFASYVRRFAPSPHVQGVRQVLQVPEAERGMCLRTEFVDAVRLLGELGLSFDLSLRPNELRDGATLATLCPDTRIVLDHCGFADPKAFLSSDRREELGDKATPTHDADEWRRGIAAVATRDNVVCKISGIVTGAPEGWMPADLAPIVDHCLESFGPDRVMFGGDWPVCTLGAACREWVEALREILSGRPEETRRKLFYENAARFFGLDN